LIALCKCRQEEVLLQVWLVLADVEVVFQAWLDLVEDVFLALLAVEAVCLV
jgi:hypothetical protein